MVVKFKVTYSVKLVKHVDANPQTFPDYVLERGGNWDAVEAGEEVEVFNLKDFLEEYYDANAEDDFVTAVADEEMPFVVDVAVEEVF